MSEKSRDVVDKAVVSRYSMKAQEKYLMCVELS